MMRAETKTRDIDTATRRRLAAEGRALPNLSYPIETRVRSISHYEAAGPGDRP